MATARLDSRFPARQTAPMWAGIPKKLERRIRVLARQMDVSPEKIAEVALRLGLDRDKIAEALCDEALDPCRQAAKRHKGKSLEHVVRKKKRRR